MPIYNIYRYIHTHTQTHDKLHTVHTQHIMLPKKHLKTRRKHLFSTEITTCAKEKLERKASEVFHILSCALLPQNLRIGLLLSGEEHLNYT